MSFPHESIRDFCTDLEKEGELVRIKKEVDWNLEAGAIARRLAELGQGRSVGRGGTPAVLFEKINGYPRGYRLLAQTHASLKRVAMALGHSNPEQATYYEIQDAYLDAQEHPIKPLLVESGPCKENKIFGDEVDLFKFPAPMVHGGDGGRYMCTWHFMATKDLDSDWQNWGVYRAMISDRQSLSGMIEPMRHIAMMYRKYEARGEPLPFAIVIGVDPATIIAAISPAPFGMSEMDVAGGFRKKPLAMVKCETSDILVPASSEIVLEGVVHLGAKAYEGPFGEYPGYRGGLRDKRMLFSVKAITWRNDPILTMSCLGVPVDDQHIIAGIVLAAMVRKRLLEVGLPVTAVHIPPETADTLLVVATKTPGPGIAHSIRDIAFTTTLQQRFRKIFVFNDDVDITNVFEVLHAFSTRIHPVMGQHVSYESGGHGLFPFGTPEEKRTGTVPGCLYDGTWPVHWDPATEVPVKSSFKTIYPEEVQRKVLNRWKEYGLA